MLAGRSLGLLVSSHLDSHSGFFFVLLLVERLVAPALAVSRFAEYSAFWTCF